MLLYRQLLSVASLNTLNEYSGDKWK